MKIKELFEVHWSSDEARLLQWCDCNILNKQNILKAVLKDYRTYINSGLKNYIVMLKDTIKLARKLGYDYPEFKTIEKHIEAHTS